MPEGIEMVGQVEGQMYSTEQESSAAIAAARSYQQGRATQELAVQPQAGL